MIRVNLMMLREGTYECNRSSTLIEAKVNACVFLLGGFTFALECASGNASLAALFKSWVNLSCIGRVRSSASCSSVSSWICSGRIGACCGVGLRSRSGIVGWYNLIINRHSRVGGDLSFITISVGGSHCRISHSSSLVGRSRRIHDG